ncbi:MAG TPA: hypothetical protein VFV38_33275 [Ktedonobacteraceae bacterium]|nr:hypothetical protein [Ktedonobacteraceae bacterium]
MICSHVPSPSTNKPEGWWIERATPGPCSTSTTRGRRPANARFPRPTICLPLFADWKRSVRLAERGAQAWTSGA